MWLQRTWKAALWKVLRRIAAQNSIEHHASGPSLHGRRLSLSILTPPKQMVHAAEAT